MVVVSCSIGGFDIKFADDGAPRVVFGLHHGAEGGGRGSSFHDAAVNERWRRLPAAWLAVARERLDPIATALGYTPPPVSSLWRLAAPWLLRRV